MINNISDKVELNNGIKMPWLGLGVMRLDDGKEVEYAIHNAFEAGYRSIDTAVIYGNENGVSNAIENSGLKREEIFLTSKIWNSEQGYNSTLKSFDKRPSFEVYFVVLFVFKSNLETPKFPLSHKFPSKL